MLGESSTSLDRAHDPPKADPLLLQPDPLAQLIANERAEDVLLFGGQSGERSGVSRFLFYPQRTVLNERFAIHQQGAGVRKCRAQSVEDPEAMGIDVTPVVDFPIA